MKPTLLHVIDSLALGGAEKLLCTTIQALPNYRHVVCHLHMPDHLAGSFNGATVYYLGWQHNFDILICSARLRRIIKREQPLLLHAHLIKSTWVGRLASINLCPFVFTVHNKLSADAFLVNRLSLLLERWSYTAKQALIAVSTTVLKDYNHWVGVRGVAEVVYNPVERPFFQSHRLTRGAGTPLRLVAIGNLRSQKNYFNILKAFCLLTDLNIQLDVFGSGREREQLQHYIDAKNLPVCLKGTVSTIAGLLPEYDAFIQASLFEGYGIAVAEAMAAGIPLVLSSIDVFHEISCGHALFFEPHDPVSIAAVIRRFAQMHVQDLQDMCDKASARAGEIARVEVLSQKLSAFYNQVLSM